MAAALAQPAGILTASREHWEREATNWARWARRPDFDPYWSYSPAFFDLLPPPGRLTLEVGCGEGRVSRDLKGRGHRVVGVDFSPTLLTMARAAESSIEYVRCDAARLPFRDSSFDLAVFYNSLMDFDDMEGSVREAARVLTVGGRMCVTVTHPFQEVGGFASTDADAPFVIDGSYLGERRAFDASVESEGLKMHFKGWAYPLEAYARALEDAGFAFEAIREPAIDANVAALGPGGARWQRIPLFLMWRAVKTGAGRGRGG